ncbi:MAG: hypothetical protein KDA60_22685, partial [Planctomycetales bacterium]|nr:hypothetical protein [Planctomycetales bacterium]
MSLTRKFLGSRAPALPPTVDYLVDKYRAGDSLDLSGVIVVLPGRRAGRRLLELLARRAADDSLVFYPPEVTTVGALPEELYEPKRPFASELVQGLAWVKAIKAMGRRRLTAFVSRLPADRDLRNWLNLAGVIQRQHNELAADGLDFADVVRAGTKLGGAAEAKRWKLLKDIQQGYLAILDDLGLWDRQTARLFAIEHRECRTERDIVLVATADMNRALRLMLGQVADRVTTLVHAPTAWADRFDPFGCLLPAIWEEVQLPIDPDQVMVVDAPSDQARAVLQFIADLQGEFRIDQVTVGVTDERVVPELQRQFMQYNVPTRWAIGRMLAETTPYRLLEVIGRYVERGRMSDFHALLRHPDVFAWVERQGVEGDWLTQLDRYYQDHLPPKTGDWIGSEQKTADLHAIDDAVSSVLKPLHAEAQPLRTWAAQTAQVLTDFYADVEFDREESVEHYTLEALQHLRAILLEMQAIADDVSPVVSASQAIQVILERLRRIQIAPPPLDQPPLEL